MTPPLVPPPPVPAQRQSSAKPAQCEAMRGKDRCPNEARCYWAEMDRWVCTTHILSAETHIRFIERPVRAPMP